MQLNINGDFLGRFAHFKKKLYLCSKFILHDSKQLSLKQFAYLCEKMVEVEDHLKKWKAYYNQ